MRDESVGGFLKVSQFLRKLLLFLVAVMLLVGSSSEHKSTEAVAAGPKGKLDACALLTAEDAAEVLGDKVTKSDAFPRNMELQGGKILNSACQYDATSSDRAVGLNITYAPMNKGRYPKTLAEYRKMSAGEAGPPDEGRVEPTAVQGVGDFAVWSIQYGVGALTVYWKEYKAIITIGSYEKGAGESDREPAITAAKKVLGEL